MSRALKVRSVGGGGRALHVDTGQDLADFASAQSLQALIAQLVYYKVQADQWFNNKTEGLAVSSATSDNLVIYPYAGDQLTIDAGNFAHSWAFSLYPGIDSRVTMSQRNSWSQHAVPYQHEMGDATYTETTQGWELREEGERDAFGTALSVTKEAGSVVIIVGEQVHSFAVPDEHSATIFCDPSGMYFAHAFPFRELTIHRLSEWQSFGARSIAAEPPVAFDIPTISGFVHDTIGEKAYQGDIEACAILAFLNNFYSLVLDYAGNTAVDKLQENYSKVDVERNALTLVSTYLSSSLVKNAVIGTNVDHSFTAPMTAGMEFNPTIRGEFKTAVGGGDRTRNPHFRFGDKQVLPSRSPYNYDKDGVSFTAYCTLSDAEWFGDSTGGWTGALEVHTMRDGPSSAQMWIEVPNLSLPVRVYKKFHIFGDFPTVSGAGARLTITVTSSEGTYEFIPDLSEEDGKVTFSQYWRMEYDEYYHPNMDGVGRGYNMPPSGTNEVGMGPTNFCQSGLACIDLTWRCGWNSTESFVNECIHRAHESHWWYPAVNTDDVEVRFKLSYVPPLYPQPTVVDQVEDELKNVAIMSAIKIQVNSIKIADNAQRISTLEEMSRPTLLGALSGGILTAASFLQPGVGLTLAMLAGAGLDTIDKIDRGYFADGVTETVALLLSTLTQRRLKGGKVNADDDFIQNMQRQIDPKNDAQRAFAEHRRNFLNNFSNSKYAVQLGQGSPVGKFSLSTNWMTQNAKKIGPIPTLTGQIVPRSFQKLYDRMKNRGVLPEHQSISLNTVTMIDDEPVGLHVSLGVSDGMQRNTGTFPIAAGPSIFPSEPGVSFIPHNGRDRVLSVSDFGGTDDDLIKERKARMLMLGYPKTVVANTPNSILLNGWKEPALRKYMLKTNAIVDSAASAPSAESCSSIVRSMTNAAFREKWGYDIRNNNCQTFANSAWETLKTGSPVGPASAWFNDYSQAPLSGVMSRGGFLNLLRDMNNHIVDSFEVREYVPLYICELADFKLTNTFDLRGTRKLAAMMSSCERRSRVSRE